MYRVTVQLQAFDYCQLSNYSTQNTAVYASITFEEIAIVMIKCGNHTSDFLGAFYLSYLWENSNKNNYSSRSC